MKKRTTELESATCSVVVVGAGIAGLAAARALVPVFPDLVVLEATEQIGGRIKQVHDVLPWAVEIGAEFIHGSKGHFQDLIKKAGMSLKSHSWPDQWYFNGKGVINQLAGKDPDIEAVMLKLGKIGVMEPPKQDLSVEQWLRNDGASDLMVDIADACYANDLGCSLSQLGTREAIIENQMWESGDDYLVLDRSLNSLVQFLSQPVTPCLQLRWPVTSIRYDDEGVIVSGVKGQKIFCKHVIVTASLRILQCGDIAFQPQLPQRKKDALQRIQMSNAIKVILAFQQPFWPVGLFDILCPGGFIPEFWVTRYSKEPTYAGPELYGITGFLAGSKAEACSQLQPYSIVHRTLIQLDTMFGSMAGGSDPATKYFVKACVVDWSKENYTRGAYSYPSLGAEQGDREILGESVGSSLYFAGEATHPGVNPCLQAAYETGLRAAQQVILAQDVTAKINSMSLSGTRSRSEMNCVKP